MGAFNELVEIMARLRSKDGCAWDLEQTMESYPKHIREEAEELFEAIDSGDMEHIKEELGDLIWTLVFYAQLAKDENLFTIEDALVDIKDKIIRRHPHIFGDVKANSVQEIKDNWDKIKQEERKKR